MNIKQSLIKIYSEINSNENFRNQLLSTDAGKTAWKDIGDLAFAPMDLSGVDEAFNKNFGSKNESR